MQNKVRRRHRVLLSINMWKRVSASPRLRVSTSLVLLLTGACLLFTAACRRDMQDQPKMKPYRTSTFFKDGLSSRPPVEGTVPRGLLRTDVEYYTGKKAGRATTAGATQPAASGANQPATGSQPNSNLTGAAAYPDDVEEFPLEVTQDLVMRGKDRFEIFCTACHGLTGKGDGMIVRRGFRRAASFHDENLKQAPVGHYFDAITNGWGAMPSYSHQISVKDRWAIIAYIRALQLTQQTGATAAATPVATPATSSGGHR